MLLPLFEEIKNLSVVAGEPNATFTQIGEALDALDGMPARLEVALREIRGSLILHLSAKAGFSAGYTVEAPAEAPPLKVLAPSPKAPATPSEALALSEPEAELTAWRAPRSNSNLVPLLKLLASHPEGLLYREAYVKLANQGFQVNTLARNIRMSPCVKQTGKLLTLTQAGLAWCERKEGSPLPRKEAEAGPRPYRAPREGTNSQAALRRLKEVHPEPLSFSALKADLQARGVDTDNLWRNLRVSKAFTVSEDGQVSISKDPPTSGEYRGIHQTAKEGTIHMQIVKIVASLHPLPVTYDFLFSEIGSTKQVKGQIRIAVYQSGLLQVSESKEISLSPHGLKWTTSLRSSAPTPTPAPTSTPAPAPAPMPTPTPSLLSAKPEIATSAPASSALPPAPGKLKRETRPKGSMEDLLFKALVSAHPNPVSVLDLAKETNLPSKTVRSEALRSTLIAYVGTGSHLMCLSKHGLSYAKARGMIPRSARKARRVVKAEGQGELFKSAET